MKIKLSKCEYSSYNGRWEFTVNVDVDDQLSLTRKCVGRTWIGAYLNLVQYSLADAKEVISAIWRNIKSSEKGGAE